MLFKEIIMELSYDISDPTNPVLINDYECPASQSDVSVYETFFVLVRVRVHRLWNRRCSRNMTQIARESVFSISQIFKILSISPMYKHVAAHTHSVLKDPNDNENIYVCWIVCSAVK